MLFTLSLVMSLAQGADPRASLLDADRRLGRATPGTNVVTHLGAAFDRDVVLFAAGRAAHGADSARALLASVPVNTTAEIEWAPIAAGTSADGRTGYTFGYTVMRGAGQPEARGKYIAFWTRRGSDWKMLVFKRVPGTGATPLPAQSASAELWPAVPSRAARGDSLAFAAELRAAELAFSASAPTLGLAAAFRANSAPDGVHTAGPNDASFRRGPVAIGEGVGDVAPGTTISWAPSLVHVAATGDVGVTVGTITIVQAGSAPRDVPFCTIWKRASPRDPWKLAAE